MSKTPLQRKMAEATMRLEFKKAEELSRIVTQISREMSKSLSGMPEVPSRRQLLNLVESTRVDLNKRLSEAAGLDDVYQAGLDQAIPLTGSEAKIPKSSVFYEFTPVLPVDALTLAESEYLEAIQGVTADFKRKASTIIRVDLGAGKGIEEIKRDLVGVGLTGRQGRDGVFRNARWRAELIGRTTVNDLANRGRMVGYLQIDDEFPELEMRKQWSAAGDTRVSDICKELNGQTQDINDDFVSSQFTGQQPPAHIQCRSAVFPVTRKYNDRMELTWSLRN
ncbi:putative minor head protein [Acaryochloris phage A-HIS2]|nr:putative minor head protein [Acaryochloris phage A-HIS2]